MDDPINPCQQKPIISRLLFKNGILSPRKITAWLSNRERWIIPKQIAPVILAVIVHPPILQDALVFRLNIIRRYRPYQRWQMAPAIFYEMSNQADIWMYTTAPTPISKMFMVMVLMEQPLSVGGLELIPMGHIVLSPMWVLSVGIWM